MDVDDLPIVVVGAGPVGVRILEELALVGAGDPQARSLILYGEEKSLPYNRIQLSSLLAGEKDVSAIELQSPVLKDAKVDVRLGCRVQRIFPGRHHLLDSTGRIQPYKKLIIATGSSPFVPGIPGAELSGVFTFRDLRDTEELVARRTRTSHTVIIGGGLLGLECARAMQRFNTNVTVIEHSSRLMFRQLDDRAGDLFREEVENLGIKVRVNTRVEMLLGTISVEGVALKGGEVIPCDTVIFAAGIVPNTVLARSAGLLCSKGIVVDDQMRTSEPDIFAVGECAEHRGRVYGLVAPGFEQAAIAANAIGGESALYQGSQQATSLKVIGCSLFSTGDVDDIHGGVIAAVHEQPGVYRRINFHRGRIEGVVAMGEWPQLSRIREAAKRGEIIWPWQRYRFEKTGDLFSDGDSIDVQAWPETATICHCAAVSKGRLCEAIANGCCSVEQISENTGASTVCGSCKPLVQELLATDAAPEPVKFSLSLKIMAGLALLVACLGLLLPGMSFSNSVQNIGIDTLWIDTDYKLISGFTLLGLSTLLAAVSLRKRIRKISLGSFDMWRLVHLALGVATIAILFLHTGFRLGSNLNFFLMTSFMGLIGFGGALGLAYAQSQRLGAMRALKLQTTALWGHVLCLWPFPALIAVHILMTYYF